MIKHNSEEKQRKRLFRERRTRAPLRGAGRPRLCVFRSLKQTSGQVIDDGSGKTVAAAFDHEVASGSTKTDRAFATGELIAQRAIEKGIREVVFDRGHYRYHGRVRAFADGARKGGLQF